ncbi:MAG: hypothetical protein D6814_04025 [Calditrichaeota bacterium]|nr:MAG: hypothetical protein D6814_04025 [Calditrichota bacterium]
MTNLDWSLVALYTLIAVAIGVYYRKYAGKNIEEYFIKGRKLSWWLMGVSAVATYTDAGLAPAVTMWVYQGGLLGNGVWWIPYVIWMPLAAVFWSKFWRRLRTITTAEMLEVRYAGRAARVYRGLYAFFMSFGFVVMLMGYVSGWLSAALRPILGWEPVNLIIISGIVTVFYTSLAGQYGVVYGDLFQFIVFLLGNIIFVPIAVAAVGGMDAIYANIHTLRGAQAQEFFNVLPPNSTLTGLTILAFVVQGMFFAASPTGGEGFTAQRFMAAKNEFHAQVGQLFNAVLTLIVRVLPFIFLGMVGAAIFKPGTISEPGEIWARLVHKFSPTGLTGLLVAGIFAGYMSTISTEMNWGASYVVNDLYKRFIKTHGTDRHYVLVSRFASILLFGLSLFVAYYLVKGMQAWFLFINSVVFAFMLPLSWLRFFWWRLNIYGEAAALVIGLPLGYIVWFPLGFSKLPFWQGFLILFGLGWLIIITVTILTRPERLETLKEFYHRCRPPGLWGPVTREFSAKEVSAIQSETRRDILDCGLGIIFCACSILASISLFAKNYVVFLVAILGFVMGGGLFVYRWKKRGVFQQLF